MIIKNNGRAAALRRAWRDWGIEDFTITPYSVRISFSGSKNRML
jgi:hypothetical protein